MSRIERWFNESDLTAYDRLLLILVAVRTHGGRLWDPVQEEIARAMGVSQTTVSRSRMKLVASGLLVTSYKNTEGIVYPGLYLPQESQYLVTTAPLRANPNLKPLHTRSDKVAILDAAKNYTAYMESGDRMKKMRAQLAVEYGLLQVQV